MSIALTDIYYLFESSLTKRYCTMDEMNTKYLLPEEIGNLTGFDAPLGISVAVTIINDTNMPVGYLDPVMGPTVIQPDGHRLGGNHRLYIMVKVTVSDRADLENYFQKEPRMREVLENRALVVKGACHISYSFGVCISTYKLPRDTVMREPLTGVIYALGLVAWEQITLDTLDLYKRERTYAKVTGIDYVSANPKDALYLVGTSKIERIPSVAPQGKRLEPGIYVTQIDESGSKTIIFNLTATSCREGDSNLPLFETLEEAQLYLHARGGAVTPAASSKTKKGATPAPVPRKHLTFNERIAERERLVAEERAARAAARTKSPKPIDVPHDQLTEPFDVSRRAGESLILEFARFAFSYVVKLTHAEGLGKWAITK